MLLEKEEKEYLVKNYTGDFGLLDDLYGIIKRKDLEEVNYNGKTYSKGEILECIDYLENFNDVKSFTEREEILSNYFGRIYDLYSDMVAELLKILQFEEFWDEII